MDASWFEPIRAYCERGDASFWAEPVNALSNGAFLIAGLAASRKGRGDPAAMALAGLVGIVGIGSFLFHTHANRWSMLADVVPIGLFILAYFGLAMRRLLGLTPRAAGLATLLFTGFNFGLAPALDAVTGADTRGLTNGSVEYLPAALALFGVGAAMIGTGEAAVRDGGRAVVGIGLLFLVSLAFRTIDPSVCARLPLGTHFLWHILNAAVLYGLIAVAATVGPRGRARLTRPAPQP